MTKLNLNEMEMPLEARRRAENVAAKLVKSPDQLSSLLNPMTHHANPQGKRRAAQLTDAYNQFRAQTIEQVLSANGLPVGEARERFEADLIQRGKAVNSAFENLVCHGVAELADPTPVPTDRMQAPDNVRLHNLGPAPMMDISMNVVRRMNERAGHFWNSVQHRIEQARLDWRNERPEVDEDADLF